MQCPAPLALYQDFFDAADAIWSPRITPKRLTNRTPYGTMMMLIETLVVGDIVSPTVQHSVRLIGSVAVNCGNTEPLGMLV